MSPNVPKCAWRHWQGWKNEYSHNLPQIIKPEASVKGLIIILLWFKCDWFMVPSGVVLRVGGTSKRWDLLWDKCVFGVLPREGIKIALMWVLSYKVKPLSAIRPFYMGLYFSLSQRCRVWISVGRWSQVYLLLGLRIASLKASWLSQTLAAASYSFFLSIVFYTWSLNFPIAALVVI